jgi:hypothetical protein
MHIWRLLLPACPMVASLLSVATLAQQPAARPLQAHPYRTLLLISDVDCTMQLDGEGAWSLVANQPKKIGVDEGQHLLSCKSQEGVVANQESDVSASTPRQTIVKFALASLIASQKAEQLAKQQQEEAEAQQALAVKAAEDAARAQAELNVRQEKDQIDEISRRISGTSGCKAKTYMTRLNGTLRTQYGSITGDVPVREDSNEEFSFASGSPGVLTGELRKIRQRQLTSEQEAYTRGAGSAYTSALNPAYPVCFNDSDAGRCTQIEKTTWTYEISQVSIVDKEHIKLTLGQGVCSGDCPADHYRKSGTTATLRLPEGNPGFYYSTDYCSH